MTSMNAAPVATEIELKTLSSSGTFFMKFLFPTLFTLFWATSILVFPMEDDEKDELTVFGLIGSFFLLKDSGVKRVRVGPHALYVSNFVDEVAVPFEQIKDVTQTRWYRPATTLTVHFREPTVFGDSISFIAKGRSAPIVAELKAHLGSAAAPQLSGA
jgi:hypothetical protein